MGNGAAAAVGGDVPWIEPCIDIGKGCCLTAGAENIRDSYIDRDECAGGGTVPEPATGGGGPYI